jgi:ribonuclease HII
MNSLLTIGIDEAGRGPLAGPVSVGAFIFLSRDRKQISKIFRGVKESKQLTEDSREEWFKKILKARKTKLINFKVVLVSAETIDKKGISPAIKSALNRALKSLGQNPNRVEVLLDGGLHAPKEYKKQKTIIKGDVKIQAIALASICAKVMRDRVMRRMAKLHPQYAFETHKGYGTELHSERIRIYGLSPIHRRTFCRSFAKT